MDPATALAVGKVALPIVAGLFHRRRRRPKNPTGYVTPEDIAAAEATRSRGVEGARNEGKGLTIEALRRSRQRGIDTAPAIEATLGRIGQGEAEGVQHAGDVAEQQLYAARQSNLGFERQKYLRERGYDELKDATFWNSILDYSPVAMEGLDQLMSHKRATGAVSAASDAGSSRRRYNPATGRFETPVPSALGRYDVPYDDSGYEGDY